MLFDTSKLLKKCLITKKRQIFSSKDINGFSNYRNNVKKTNYMDEQKKLEKEFSLVKKETFLLLMNLGIQEDKLENNFKSSNAFNGNVGALKDFVWGQFNKHISENSDNWDLQSRIYESMVHFRYKYESVKDVSAKKLAMDAFKNSNEHLLERSDINIKAQIVSFHTSCPVCYADNLRLIDLEEFFSTDIIPHKNCTCPGMGCSCRVGFRRIRNIDEQQ